MAWSRFQIIIAIVMVITGTINTLATKWADDTSSIGSDGTSRPFNHPFLQATFMFLGEMLCLLVFKIMYLFYKKRELKSDAPLPAILEGNQNFNPLIFYPPALCDMFGTSIMYMGLNLTYASSFQMLRGAVIIFTGLLSGAFLNRHLRHFEWSGILIVMAGLACVGISDVVYPSADLKHHDQNSLLTGDLLIVLAQIITASQMVIEEKFVIKHNVPPLQGVGWEGVFGFCTLSILLVVMYYIPGGSMIFHNPNKNMEDAIDGFVQIHNSWKIKLGMSGTVLSIAFFNFAGLSVTKEVSATTRMVLDSVRTFAVWIFSLSFKWQEYTYLQLIGFIVLLFGMCLYNDVIIRPFINKYLNKRRGENEDTKPIINKDGQKQYLSTDNDMPRASTVPGDGSINV